MHRLLPFLLTSLILPFAVCQQTSQPLTEAEKRTILSQLVELQACRAQLAAYSDFVSRETQLDLQAKANFDRALELEKQATLLAQKERDLAQEKANLYENLYRSVARKPGWWCKLRRILTLGITRCS